MSAAEQDRVIAAGVSAVVAQFAPVQAALVVGLRNLTTALEPAVRAARSIGLVDEPDAPYPHTTALDLVAVRTLRAQQPRQRLR